MCFDGFTDRAKEILFKSIQESYNLNQEYITSEAIIFSILKDERGNVAKQTLNTLGVTTEKIKTSLRHLFKDKFSYVNMDKLSSDRKNKYSTPIPAIIKDSLDEAKKNNENVAGTEHLLLGIINDSTCTAVHVFSHLNISVELIRKTLYNLLGKKEDKAPVIILAIHTKEILARMLDFDFLSGKDVKEIKNIQDKLDAFIQSVSA